MKKKRRFINWGTMLVLSVIVGFFVYKVSHRYYINYAKGVFEQYSNADYEYLAEIAEKAIIKGKGINTEGIPDDVYYQIKKGEDNKITFEYGFKEHRFFLNLPKNLVTLSQDKRPIDSKSAGEIKKAYIEKSERTMLYSSVATGFMFGITFYVIYFVYYACKYVWVRESDRK